MNLQAQQKVSNRRTGKRISFFEQGQAAPLKEEPPLKEGHLYSSGGNLPIFQVAEHPKIDGVSSSAPSNFALLNSVIFTQDRCEQMRLSQQLPPDKWQSSVMVNRERSDASWQTQPSGMWNHNMVVYGGSQKTHVPSFYNHREALKRSQEKGIGISQLDMYGDAVQQMMSQKAQLEQQALVRQQAHLNSILQAQKQQQQQSQTLSLQPFQLAFGHQGQKQGLPLPELFHVFQEGPIASNAAFTAQQKQALPQMQLFENFYPAQQQQQQAVAAAQAFSVQQAACMAQSHGSAQHQVHMVGQFQQAPAEMSQQVLNNLSEQNQQTHLPKAQPRRSRRLSKEGVPPPASTGGVPACKPGEEQVGNPFMQPWQEQHGLQLHPQLDAPSQQKTNYQPAQKEVLLDNHQGQLGNHHQSQTEAENLSTCQNGRGREAEVAIEHSTLRGSDGGEGGGITGGVIQSTRRRRRVSQEANLLTLAQKAVELASLQNVKDKELTEEKQKSIPSRTNVEFANSPPSKRVREESNLTPLIIPVSVPVRKIDFLDFGQQKGEEGQPQRISAYDRGPSELEPTVIVTRQRSCRTNMEPVAQDEQAAAREEGEILARKPKQRPRPEPLFIPPKPGTFIAPAVYSNITPYQSHLRSPVRLADHPSDRNFELPPYTPPPILSPVREGSGLYFNAIISASSLSMPPPFTPKSSTRTLLRTNSSEVTPPLLSVVGEGTPVSIEPRINVGTRFQAEIPELRDRCLANLDKHKADLVWRPWGDLDINKATQDKVEDLLAAACSSILPGAGTNQELAFHCLNESKGNILSALTKLLLRRPRRSRTHPLTDYHYAGSDRWTLTEKKLFNKGIAVYKKDFLLVQKLIKSKTVAQCVEFYYTYKKQVKIGRNGALIFGDVDRGNVERSGLHEAEVDIKSSRRLEAVLPLRGEIYKEQTETSDPRVKPEVQMQVKPEREEIHDQTRTSIPLKVTQTLQANEIANDLLVLRSQDPSSRTLEKPKEATTVRSRKASPAEKKKPDAVCKPPDQESTFPCKKCGKVFFKVKSRSAHMKSHSEQEKKAAALRQKQSEEAAAAAAAVAARLNVRQDESSESDSDSSCSSDSGSSSDSSDREI
ncbi:ELM2 and SANT domain-containing protein 1 isoform X2 [Rhinatrema bivittatum]|uniref:ELM2 and SANT domain-containing protein 1 isoform X2 n=1 Tax=Rhinatrema bivittatum TaxID=194408 RepID=UPI001128A9FD|nr:ELM2 and SANT domain-containing protein 1 isoform X2 [Rhinatrema bivittatum]